MSWKTIVAPLGMSLLIACSNSTGYLTSSSASVVELIPSSTVSATDFSGIDPQYNIDFENAFPEDFADCFSNVYEVAHTSYLIGAETDFENEVTVISSKQNGASIYIVAGVHGDEEAAWRAGELLKKASIKAGTLYILAPANRQGATANPLSRYVAGFLDLNRNFPGNVQGNLAQMMANSIFEDIKRIDPEFVLDLHEARPEKETRDFLGSSLIFTDLGEKSDLLMQIILETQHGTLCSEAFNYFTPAPNGSINKTVSKELVIPTITVETFRGYPMETRVSDQLSMVGRLLQEYKML
ncbi:succinylglutamate desuccinylase/aspartoacylase family protein [Oscillospiraceae bacterium LTW-04]|nr:succinylglutamate desuccinylase/aspartoacylase family protein [Oscillospiraceae bacterium MB24-C1]